MMKNSGCSMALCAVLLTSACTENPTAVVSPDISVRSGKATQPAPSSISVMALGKLPHTDRGDYGIAFALNNGAMRSATRVAGSTTYGTTKEYPFTWTQGAGMTPLAVVEPHRGWPFGVSDNGFIVGEINTISGLQPFIVTASGPMSYLPVPSGTVHGGARGISADGSCISGWVSDGVADRAVIWRNGVLEILGSGSADGVTNDCLTVAGTSQARAAVWRNVAGSWVADTLPSRGSGAKFIGPVKSVEVTDISPSGEYLSGRRVDSASTSAVVWRRTTSGWVATDLAASAFAFGVDNSGRVVGVNATGEPTLWTRSSAGAYSSKVLPSLGRDTQGWAESINELGQIVGRSRNREGWQAVIWTVL